MAHSGDNDACLSAFRTTAARETGSAGSGDGVVLPFRPRRDRPDPVWWHSIEPRARFATVSNTRAGLRLHLIVEQLPDTTAWDWLVWQADAAAAMTKAGNAPSVLAAVGAAEAAARDWWLNPIGQERFR